MTLGLDEKVAAFCRELNTPVLPDLAAEHGAADIVERLRNAVTAGRVGPAEEADLDALDALVRQVEGVGLYPGDVRSYRPLTGAAPASGAAWWSCPAGLCAGYGRVKPGQDPPVCGAIGTELVSRPTPL
ncbi:hypothetical protein ACGFNU_34315 [Spirillospora sp. NPDC048911]|uniref:hypothetical protein n=1 Tax=Spirillospora sp. NPDC048911 TaxID=3364527 RepID=UPI003712834E